MCHFYDRNYIIIPSAYFFIRPLYSDKVVKVDSVPLSWLILQFLLEMRAECIKRGASQVNQLI